MTEWNRYESGRGWKRIGPFIVAETPPTLTAKVTHVRKAEGYLYRTKGDPTSMEQLLRDYDPIITEAANAFELPTQQITACIGIEATRLPDDHLRFNPRSIRLEPGYRSDADTPDKVSPGLMQTLLATAGDMVSRCPWLNETRSSLTREDLFVPRYSVSLGAAYIRYQIDRVEADEVKWGLPPDDPIANAVAAYNAGSVRGTRGNDWHLVTYSPTRIDRFIAWWNDTVEVLGYEA